MKNYYGFMKRNIPNKNGNVKLFDVKPSYVWLVEFSQIEINGNIAAVEKCRMAT